MKTNRVTISLDNNSKKILDENSSKYNVSKSDMISYLINHAKYPKYNKFEKEQVHSSNVEIARIENNFNKIQLNFNEACNNYNQIARSLNIMAKHSGDDAFITAHQKGFEELYDNSNSIQTKLLHIYNQANLLYQEVTKHVVR